MRNLILSEEFDSLRDGSLFCGGGHGVGSGSQCSRLLQGSSRLEASAVNAALVLVNCKIINRKILILPFLFSDRHKQHK